MILLKSPSGCISVTSVTYTEHTKNTSESSCSTSRDEVRRSMFSSFSKATLESIFVIVEAIRTQNQVRTSIMTCHPEDLFCRRFRKCSTVSSKRENDDRIRNRIGGDVGGSTSSRKQTPSQTRRSG